MDTPVSLGILSIDRLDTLHHILETRTILFLLLLPVLEGSSQRLLANGDNILFVHLDRPQTIPHKPCYRIILLAILVGVRQNTLRRLQIGAAVVRLVNVNQIRHEGGRPLHGTNLQLNRLINRVLARLQLIRRPELGRKTQLDQPTPCAVICRGYLGKIITRQIELALQKELQNLGRLGEQVTSLNLFTTCEVLDCTHIQRTLALVGFRHRDPTLAPQLDDIGCSGPRLLTRLRKQGNGRLAGIVAHRRVHQIHQHGLAVGARACPNVKLL